MYITSRSGLEPDIFAIAAREFAIDIVSERSIRKICSFFFSLYRIKMRTLLSLLIAMVVAVLAKEKADLPKVGK